MFRPTRYFLTKLLPKPGEGPSREALIKGYMKTKVIAYSEERDDGTRAKVTGNVVFKHDAGYLETSKMLAEAAICMALDDKKIPMTAGFVTPVAAMGETYLQRLVSAGIEFSIDEAATPAKKTE